MFLKLLRTSMLVSALVVAAMPAGATLLVVGAPTITMNGPSDFTWDYDVFLGAGSVLLPPGTPCASSIVGGICDGLLTIYDFAGYIDGSITSTAAGWTSLVPAAVGITPLGLTPTDGPALNLSWAFTSASTVSAGAVPLFLGTFSAQSLYGDTTLTSYAGRSAVEIAGNATRSANLDTTLAPLPATVPEPGSVFLLGAALLGLTYLRSGKSRDD